MKRLFALSIVIVYGSAALAEADLNTNIFNPSATNSGTSATREGSGTTTGAGAATPKMAAMPGSINPGSNTGQQSQKNGSGSNSAAGAALMAAGAALMANPPTMPAGAALMAMGMLAMMQSGEDDGAAGQSGATGAASVYNSGTGTGTSTTPTDANGSSSFAAQKIKEGQAKLAEAGYKMTEKGLTTPDGKFIPASSFNTPAGMAAAGMTPAAIAEAQKIIADADGGARVSGVAVNGGGGGGSGVTEGESSGSSETGGPPLGNPFHLDGDKKGQLVAGKTIMFDGEPIGVRGQNIFEMVHQCYQKKRDGRHFIESESDVATRMPASFQPKK